MENGNSIKTTVIICTLHQIFSKATKSRRMKQTGNTRDT